jgi:hypothetical protein
VRAYSGEVTTHGALVSGEKHLDLLVAIPRTHHLALLTVQEAVAVLKSFAHVDEEDNFVHLESTRQHPEQERCRGRGPI